MLLVLLLIRKSIGSDGRRAGNGSAREGSTRMSVCGLTEKRVSNIKVKVS